VQREGGDDSVGEDVVGEEARVAKAHDTTRKLKPPRKKKVSKRKEKVRKEGETHRGIDM